MTDHKICKYKNKKIKGGAEIFEGVGFVGSVIMNPDMWEGMGSVIMLILKGTLDFVFQMGEFAVPMFSVISNIGEGVNTVIITSRDAAPLLMQTGTDMFQGIGSVASGAAQTMSVGAEAMKGVVSKGANVVTNAMTNNTFTKNTDIVKATVTNILDGTQKVFINIKENPIFKGWLKHERNKMIYGDNYNSFDILYYNNVEPLSIRRHEMAEDEVEKKLKELKKKREEETSQAGGSGESQEVDESQEDNEPKEGDESQEGDKPKNTLSVEVITNNYWGKNDATYLAICKMCKSYGGASSENQWVLVNEEGVNFFQNTINFSYYGIDDKNDLGGVGLISLEEFVNEENVDDIKLLFDNIKNSNPTVYTTSTIKAKKLLIEFLKRYLHTFIEKMNDWEDKKKKEYIHSLYKNKSYFGNDKYYEYISEIASDLPASIAPVPPPNELTPNITPN